MVLFWKLHSLWSIMIIFINVELVKKLKTKLLVELSPYLKANGLINKIIRV